MQTRQRSSVATRRSGALPMLLLAVGALAIAVLPVLSACGQKGALQLPQAAASAASAASAGAR